MAIEYNFNDFTFNKISNDNTTYEFGSNSFDYVRVSILNSSDTVVSVNNEPGIFYSNIIATNEFPNGNPIWTELNITIPRQITINGIAQESYLKTNLDDFKIYKDTNNNFYIKPNEILNKYNFSENDYKIKIDFLNQFQYYNKNFEVREKSLSSKEIRLKFKDTDKINTSADIVKDFNNDNSLANFMLNDDGVYKYDCVLYSGLSDNVITNFTFDQISNGQNNQSLILRFQKSLDGAFNNLSIVTIEKEIISSQTRDVFYKSELEEKISLGSLPYDSTFEDEYGPEDDYENLNAITSGSSLDVIGGVLSGSIYNYPNLNLDYNQFENHTFFGSATSKLENFRVKLGRIEGHYSNISASLTANGVTASYDNTTGISDTPSLVKLRSNLFQKIQDEINLFTPYEEFLYFDGQSQTTSSAPSIGKNYAFSGRDAIHGLNTSGHIAGAVDMTTFIPSQDGFKNVFHIEDDGREQRSHLFRNTYRVEKKPFFNYSGSVYLSYLAKGDSGSMDDHNIRHSYNGNHDGLVDFTSPRDASHQNKLTTPDLKYNKWQRYIFRASQSYWIPNDEANYDTSDGNLDTVKTVADGGNYIVITSSLGQSGQPQAASDGNPYSASIKSSDSWQYLSTVVTQSGVPFTGSISPSGDLFSVFYVTGSIPNQMFMTDVKVTLNNPSNAQTFAQVYPAGSSEWDEWYNTQYQAAKYFDEVNINSLNNNLPEYLREANSSADLKKFLSMIGEHFDLIRNHIDNYSKLYKRNYDKLDSVPNNLLPILLGNMGWEALPNVSSSLSQYFGDSLSSVTNNETLESNTWRKTLNNLIYIYKTKGTLNSVRALLNIYGYPPDVLGMSEYGGSSEEHNPSIITNEIKAINDGLEKQSQNISFVRKSKKLYHYNFVNTSNRILNFDWWMNDANPETIEFIYKYKKPTATQEILMVSGSGASTLWDLRLNNSAASESSSFEFRLSFNQTGSNTGGDIAASALSMSTDYTHMRDGELWNVMLQRMTSSISGSGTNQYKLYTALQDRDKIVSFNAVSMSVVGEVQTVSTASFKFIQSASQDAEIILVSSDGTSKTYVASGSSINGALSGSFVLFNTGSSTANVGGASSSVAESFLAAVTSSNGHGSRFNVSNTLGSVLLTQDVAGVNGNSSIVVNTLFTNKTNPNPPAAFVGGTTDSNTFANQNWPSSGSRTNSDNNNLFVGGTLSGSLAEFRAWDVALSASKFKQHTLNKFSVVGDSLDAHKDNLIYHYRLNENFISGSTLEAKRKIFDGNPRGPKSNSKAYDKNIPSSITTGSALYGFDLIDVYSFTLRTGAGGQENSNNIIINPHTPLVGNLRHDKSSTLSLYDEQSKQKRQQSSKLEIQSSPQNFVNDFIINNIADYDLEDKFANPEDNYKPNYNELEKFTKDFFDNYEIVVDNNKFIRAQENIYNKSIITAIQNITPARSTLSDESIGVTIKPTVLEKQKIKQHKVSIDYGSPGINGLEKIIDIPSLIEFSPSVEKEKLANLDVDIITIGSYEKIKEASIKIDNQVSSSYEKIRETAIEISHQVSSSYEKIKEASIKIDNQVKSSLEDVYNTNILILKNKVKKTEKQVGYFQSSSAVDALSFLGASSSMGFTINVPENIGGSGETITLTLTGSTLGIPAKNNVHINHSTEEESPAKISFSFIQSASQASVITLESTDGTSVKYFASGSAINGTFSTDSGSVFFDTGSGTTLGAGSASAAGNFLAAVTSSNGHGNKFNVLQNLGQVQISQSIAGLDGNTLILKSVSFNSRTNPNAPGAFTAGQSGSDTINRNSLISAFNGTNDNTLVKYGLNITSSNQTGILGVIAINGTNERASGDRLLTLQSIDNTVATNNISIENITGSIYQSSVLFTGGKSPTSEIIEEIKPSYIDSNLEKINDIIIKVKSDISSSFEKIKNVNIKINHNLSSSFEDTIDSNIIHITSSLLGEFVIPISGSNDFINTNYTKPFRDLHNEWGLGENDTHFISAFNTGSDGNNNTGHIDERFVFRMVGDVEVISGSRREGFDDFTNIRKFHNQEFVKDPLGGTIDYHTFIGGDPGIIINARAMGKTRYFFTASNGTIRYPANHISNFTYTGLDKFNYRGTQNTSPGILNGAEWEDFSTASFYRIKVGNTDNVLRVEKSTKATRVI